MVKLFNSTSTSQFKRSVKRLKKRGKDINKLKKIITHLKDKTLTTKHKDHALKGDKVGNRECHIQGDWVLVYRYQNDVLVLVDTGSHADIFGM